MGFTVSHGGEGKVKENTEHIVVLACAAYKALKVKLLRETGFLF